MPWVKLDDHFPDHEKLAQCGDLAPLCGWLYVCALAFCNRQLTDGRIPKAHIHKLVNFRHIQIVTGGVGRGKDRLADFTDEVDVDTLAGGLVSVGLWEEDGTDFVIHDYLDFQPSRASVLKERAETAARVRSFRKRAKTTGSNNVCNAVTNASSSTVSTASPVPVPLIVRDQRVDPAAVPNVEAYAEAWREAASASGTELRLGLTQTEVGHLMTLSGAYPLEDVTRAARAFWASPHTGGKNLGLFVAQIAEVLGHVRAGHAYPYRGRPPAERAPKLRTFDPKAWAAKGTQA